MQKSFNWKIALSSNLSGFTDIHLSHTIILHNLPCRPCPLSCRPLHKPLRLNGTMLAREMNWPLAHLLITGKERILSHVPARIASTQEWVSFGIAQRRNHGV